MELLPISFLFSFVCGNIYTYLECGIPIVGGCICNPPGDDDPRMAAVSGWRKFLRWSTRSWCCVRHRVRISGRDSRWSWQRGWNEIHEVSLTYTGRELFKVSAQRVTWTIWIFSSKLDILSSKASCLVDISDTISYTVFCVWWMEIIFSLRSRKHFRANASRCDVGIFLTDSGVVAKLTLSSILSKI